MEREAPIHPSERNAQRMYHVYILADGIPVDPLLPLGREALYLDRKDVPIP